MRKFLLQSFWPKRLLLAGILFGCAVHAYSQNLKFHKAFDSLQSGTGYHLIGQVGQNNLVLFTTPLLETGLLICDQDGNAVESKILPLPRPLLSKYVTGSANHFNIIFQQRIENTNYVQVASFDQRGNLRQPVRIIDSSRFDLLGRGAYYDIGQTANNSFSLLYRLLHGLQKDKLLVSYLLLDSNAMVTDTRSFYVPFKAELDTASSLFADASGTVVLAVHDKADNYRLGSTIQVYQLAPGKEMKIGAVYLKENKPLNISFASGPVSGKLYMGALSRNFYKKDIEGVVAVYYDLPAARPDTSFYYKLDDNFNKELTKDVSGINAKNLKKKLALTYFGINDDETPSFAVSFVSPKKGNNVGANPYRSRTPEFFLNSSTPSQSLDAIRDYARVTTLPRDTRAGSAQMVQYLNNMNTLQSWGMNSPPPPNVLPQMVARPRDLGAPVQTFWTLNDDPLMVYRTCYIQPDSLSHVASNTWQNHLYFPHAPVITSTVLKVNNKVSMLHYVSGRKNERVLEYRPLNRPNETTTQPVGASSDPTIFFGQRYVIVDKSKLLTLYIDQNLRIGLASMNIEN